MPCRAGSSRAVSNVMSISGMFMRATSFNGNISKWHVSSVTSMHSMFFAAKTFNSDISKWGVSSVTSMPGMFFEATAFNSDISKWDVSSVTNMQAMLGFTSFDSELSKWDVSRVNDMSRMFMQAKLFNGDISNWDVSSVANMDSIFFHATSFKQNLCGPEWVRSKATKEHMLGGSPGSISRTVCTIAAVFTSKAELKSAVDICFKMLNLFPTSDCSNGAHGSIVEWDVSRVTDMTSYFLMRKMIGPMMKTAIRSKC